MATTSRHRPWQFVALEAGLAAAVCAAGWFLLQHSGIGQGIGDFLVGVAAARLIPLAIFGKTGPKTKRRRAPARRRPATPRRKA
jgi:hypothetical protein